MTHQLSAEHSLPAMGIKKPRYGADFRLVEGWLRARSVARSLPQPVDDSGGLRLDTGSSIEARRYVFAALGDNVRLLAACIASPRVFIKVCTSNEELAALLPAHWEVGQQRFLMTTRTVSAAPPRLPGGYTLHRSKEGPVTSVRVVTTAGSVAAQGFSATFNNFHIYDRIETSAPHRRRGLGRAVMQALSPTVDIEPVHVLVATSAGKRLYDTLGWLTVSPYSTAELRPETQFTRTVRDHRL